MDADGPNSAIHQLISELLFEVGRIMEDVSPDLALRLPAGELDAGVRSALSASLANSDALRRQFLRLEPSQLFTLLDLCVDLSERLRAMTIAEVRQLFDQLCLRAVVSADGLEASISSQASISRCSSA